MSVRQSEKFCLRWNEFENNISKAFGELRDDNDFFDVTLACDDNQLQAHKVILSACSPLFRSLFKKNHHQHPLIFLRGVKHEDILAVLDFMYHGEVNVAQESLNSFLAVAEDLQIKGLTQTDQNEDRPTSANCSSESTMPRVQDNSSSHYQLTKRDERLKVSEKTTMFTSQSSQSKRSQINTKSVPPQIEETCIEEMEVTEEVSADLAVMKNLLDSVQKTPAPTSIRKVLRTVLTTQDSLKNTPKQQEKIKPEETGKQSQVMWIDPAEEVNRKKLADQLNKTQNLDMETISSMGGINIDNVTAMMEKKEKIKREPRLSMKIKKK